jgi:hypothetical protein
MFVAMSTFGVPEWVRYLVRAGQQAPSADNSQPWRFVWDGKSLSVHLDPVRGGAGLGLDHPANLMAMGAVIENLAQAAEAVGLPAETLRVGHAGAHEPFATITWDGPMHLPSSEREAGLFGRHTNRGAFQKVPLDSTFATRLAAMTEGPLRTVLVSETEQKKRLAALLRGASEVRFQTEEIHRWLGASLRFAPEEVERGDGLDVATLLLPPGAIGLLKLSLDWRRMTVLNRLGAFKLFAFLEAAMLQQSAALLLVAGPSQGDGIEVGAGRLLERLWVTLNEQGLAVHPYYVLADQLFRLKAGLVSGRFVAQVTRIAHRVADFLGSADETIFMLLRVGIPKIANPIRSRRLPERVTFEFSHTQ